MGNKPILMVQPLRYGRKGCLGCRLVMAARKPMPVAADPWHLAQSA